MRSLEGKKVVLGVSGGIAVYKAVELLRLLVRAKIDVKVAMTKNATRFVSPLTFEALSKNRVIYDMWEGDGSSIGHIEWGQGADLVIIAPATANIIAKAANGIGDDFLSTMLLAATAGIMFCPSMNSRMYENQAVRENINRLKSRGAVIMASGEGELACRTTGPGRLPEPAEIMEYASTLLAPHDLTGLKILITAGPTVEPMDPVRFISNRSSGKMGYSLAKAARRRGASVILVSGPVCLEPPFDVTLLRTETADEMEQAVFDKYRDCDIIIKAAAVSDYRPKSREQNKIKKGPDSMKLELVRNSDILGRLGKNKGESRFVLVGFAAETEDLLENAGKKLTAKNLDMIVANDVSASDAGFGTDTNRVKILYAGGEVEDIPLLGKDEVADIVLERAKQLLRK